MLFLQEKRQIDDNLPLIKQLNQIGRISKILKGELHNYRVEFAGTTWFAESSDSGYCFQLGERVRILGLIDATTALILQLV